MKGEALNKQTVQAIQTLRREGISVRKCAELLHVSKASVERHGVAEATACAVTATKRGRSEREHQAGRHFDLSAERLTDLLQSDRKFTPMELNGIAGTFWDKLYGKQAGDSANASNFLINLFGNGVGERFAETLKGQAVRTMAALPSDKQ